MNHFNLENLTGISTDAIVLGLCALIVILIIVMIVNGHKTRQIRREYHKFMEGADGKSLEDYISDNMGRIETIERLEVKNNEKMDEVLALYGNTFQKIGLVRYDAFNEMGGKLSFTLALLNGNNNGFVLSAVHSSEGCYTYIKEIRDGKSALTMSEEETEAVDEAIHYSDAIVSDIKEHAPTTSEEATGTVPSDTNSYARYTAEREAAEAATQKAEEEKAAAIEARQKAEEIAQKAANDTALAEESQRTAEELTKKAAAAQEAAKEATRKAAADRAAAEETAKKAAAERIAAEETVRNAAAERRAAEETARKAASERAAAEKAAQQAAVERAVVEAAQKASSEIAQQLSQTEVPSSGDSCDPADTVLYQASDSSVSRETGDDAPDSDDITDKDYDSMTRRERRQAMKQAIKEEKMAKKAERKARRK